MKFGKAEKKVKYHEVDWEFNPVDPEEAKRERERAATKARADLANPDAWKLVSRHGIVASLLAVISTIPDYATTRGNKRRMAAILRGAADHIDPAGHPSSPRPARFTAKPGQNITFTKTYTIPAKDDLPAIEWRAEKFFNGQTWSVELFRDGHPYGGDLDPDNVRDAIANRDPKHAAKIAKALLSP